MSQPTNAYSYEISNIEVLTGNAEPVTLRPNIKTLIDPRALKGIAAPVALPSDKTSMDVGILLNGVCDVNGVPLLGRLESDEVRGKGRAGALERAEKIISSGAPGAPEGSKDGGRASRNP